MTFKEHMHWHLPMYIFVIIFLVVMGLFSFLMFENEKAINQAEEFCEERGYNFNIIQNLRYCVETFDDTAKLHRLIRSDGEFYLKAQFGHNASGVSK